ncbi:MAG: ABC transporter permease, partial [Pseudomonadota bacterium]
IAIYSVIGRNAPFGDDLRLFFATGLTPVLLFVYVSRFMSISLLANKPMLSFPVVHVLDIILARAGLEFIGILLAVLIITVALVATGTDPFPIDPARALTGLAIVGVLAIGIGIIASVISAIYPVFSFCYALVIIVLYILSGAPIYLHSFPEEAVRILSWNPLFHAVDWIRSAYYLGHPLQVLDQTYLVGWAIGSLAIGLLLERLCRARVLES